MDMLSARWYTTTTTTAAAAAAGASAATAGASAATATSYYLLLLLNVVEAVFNWALSCYFLVMTLKSWSMRCLNSCRTLRHTGDQSWR
jgi:hypothetical protein